MSNAYLTVQTPHTGERAALLNEDWLAVILGLFIFVLALAAIVNVDRIGWVVNTSVRSNYSQALGPASISWIFFHGITPPLAS